MYNILVVATGLVLPHVAPVARTPGASMMADASPIETAQTAFRIYQESTAAGADFKQAVADALAGDFDTDAVTSKVQSMTNSAPLVVFTWDSSPACKKALKYFEMAGVQPKIVRLDAPWDEGNKMRAVLGRLTGKSSVPSIWIGGQYIGGCDDGPSDDAPGLVPLAFKGVLRPKLVAAGAQLPS